MVKTPAVERAALLCRIGDILERHMDELIAMCIKEAGKVAQDGIDEVREAVDFCRYYAARAIELSDDERLEARGVVLCISPWNFPLAIFLGQVAAAIATGNTVLAKPAERVAIPSSKNKKAPAAPGPVNTGERTEGSDSIPLLV